MHKDLKSSNILVKRVMESELEIGYLQTKVVDFGISKIKERSTTFSVMTYNMGSGRWMAPEVINLVPSSYEGTEELPKHKFKVDIYSFAMVCYEILTGNLPFKDVGSLKSVKEMVLEGLRPHLPNDCPPLLKVLIEKCWSQKPEERPTFAVVCSELKYLKYLLMTGKPFQLQLLRPLHFI